MKKRIFLITLVLVLTASLLMGLAACNKNGGDNGGGNEEACAHENVTLTDSLAATCITDGERSGVCPDCGETVKEPIPALGHARENGWCDRCSTGLYTNLVASAAEQSVGFYLEGLKVEVSSERASEYYASGFYRLDVSLEQEGSTFLTLDVNSDGKPVLVGKVAFKGNVSQGDKLEPSVESAVSIGLIEFDGEALYVKTFQEGEYDEDETYADIEYSLSVMPEDASVAEMQAMLEVVEEIAEKLSPILDTLRASAPKLANDLISKTFLRLFTETATNDGYTYTLSAAKVREVVDELLSEKTVGEIVAELLGEDFVAELLATVKEYAVLTPAECYDKLRAKGVEPDDIFPLLDRLLEMSGTPGADSESILTADAIMNIKLYDLVMENAEATSDDDINAAIDALYNDQVKPMLDMSIAALAGLDETMVEEIGEQVEQYIATFLDHITVTLTADKEGILKSGAVSVALEDVDLLALGMAEDEDMVSSEISSLTASIAIRLNHEAVAEKDKASTEVKSFIQQALEALEEAEISYNNGSIGIADGKAFTEIVAEEYLEYLYDETLDVALDVYFNRDYKATATLSIENMESFEASLTSVDDIYSLYIYFKADTVVRDNIEILGGYSYIDESELDGEAAAEYLELLKETLHANDVIRLHVYYNVKTGEITTESPEGLDPLY